MPKKATPRPCLNNCGRHVIGGKARLCDDCCPKCECGQRKPPDRPRCRACAAAAAEGSITWVPNGRGIVVAKR